MTREQIRELWVLCRDRIRQLDRSTAVKFKTGQGVQFVDKNYNIQVGKVVKVNTKTVKVLVGPMTWTVSPNLLKSV